MMHLTASHISVPPCCLGGVALQGLEAALCQRLKKAAVEYNVTNLPVLGWADVPAPSLQAAYEARLHSADHLLLEVVLEKALTDGTACESRPAQLPACAALLAHPQQWWLGLHVIV